MIARLQYLDQRCSQRYAGTQIQPKYCTKIDSKHSKIFTKLTSAKFCVRMSSFASGLFQLIQSPHVVLQVLVILRVDGIHLSFSRTCSEEWCDKELSKSLQQIKLIQLQNTLSPCQNNILFAGMAWILLGSGHGKIRGIY